MSATVAELKSLEPRQAAAWLRANGWSLVHTEAGRSALYEKGSAAEGVFQIELPLDTTFRDYPRRMAEVVETAAIASGKPAPWVLDEMRASTVDIIRLRSTGPAVGAGSVPMELGARIFESTRELLLAAACAAHDPRPVYRSRRSAEASDFLRLTKLTVPERGSFVVTVHVPVAPALQPVLVEELDEPPFERRSTLMLATASTAARQAAERAGLGEGGASFLEGAARGLSANLCEALAGFVDGEQATGLSIEFAWAASRRAPTGTPSLVHIGADLAPILREGARVLRASVPAPDFELEGAVTRLASENPEAGGLVVIAAQVDDRPRKVHVAMDAVDYARAIKAHSDGLLLRCEGELRRQGHRYLLERARHVALIMDEPE